MLYLPNVVRLQMCNFNSTAHLSAIMYAESFISIAISQVPTSDQARSSFYRVNLYYANFSLSNSVATINQLDAANSV